MKPRLKAVPEIGMVTGTGLGDAAHLIDVDGAIDYGDIPHFKTPTVDSHSGRLLFGTANGKPIVVLKGRSHLYEGCSSLEITFPIRVLKELGVQIVILSNASGGLNPDFTAGDIMAISDQINLTATNPLIGPNEDAWGPRFPDMSFAYDRDLLHLVEKAGEGAGEKIQKGVYAGLFGPSLETPAEARYLRTIGADAVGFSTVLETIVSVYAGLRVIGLSIVTNIHHPDNPVPADADRIIEKATETVPRLERIIRQILTEISENE